MKDVLARAKIDFALKHDQPAPALVVGPGVPGLRDAWREIADEDGQLVVVEGEDQPEEGRALAAGGEQRVGGQLRDDDLGCVR